MTLFDISTTALSFFSCWCLLLIVCASGIGVCAFRQKNIPIFVFGLALLAISFAVMQAFLGLLNDPERFTGNKLWQISVWWWCAVLVLLSVFAACVGIKLLRWSKTHISPESFAKAFNSVSVGVLFYVEGGLCLLSNNVMNRLAKSITELPLLNGEEFYKALGADTVKTPDGKVWSFRRKKLNVEERMRFGRKQSIGVYELIATDVTETVIKNQQLSDDNEKLRRINKELADYNRDMLDSIRRKEILSAKTNIHDEMNRLMLSTVHALGETDETKRKEILRLWQRNALLLCKEASESKPIDFLADLSVIADSLGIRFICNDLPELSDVSVRRVFVQVAREAMVNAVKHGGAKTMTVSVQKKDGVRRFVFANDGTCEGEVVFGGGLHTLEKMVSDIGGKLTVENNDGFAVVLEVKE